MNNDQHAESRKYAGAAKRKTSNISPNILRDAEKPSHIVVEEYYANRRSNISRAVASSVDRVANRACTLANAIQDKLGPTMGPHDEEAIEEAELEMESLRLRREGPIRYYSLVCKKALIVLRAH